MEYFEVRDGFYVNRFVLCCCFLNFEEEEGLLMERRREEEEREARGQPDFVKYQTLGYACHVFSS